MRSRLSEQECRIPSTYVVGNYAKKVIKELFAQPIPNPEPDLGELSKRATEKLTKIESELQGIKDRWVALSKKAQLERLKLKHHSPLPGESFVEGVETLIEVGIHYLWAYNLIYITHGPEDLKEMLRKIEYGELCAR
jgi:hypothetical protein